MLPSPAKTRACGVCGHLLGSRFIHFYFGEGTFKYYRHIEPRAFQLISRFDEKRLAGRSRRGTFLFDSWIVNHINLLSYRHSGVCGDLCGFNCMALLTCNLILYMNSYFMFFFSKDYGPTRLKANVWLFVRFWI